jgi:hypothetical protein
VVYFCSMNYLRRNRIDLQVTPLSSRPNIQ